MMRICTVILIITLLFGLYRDAEASPAIAVLAVAAGSTLLAVAGATSYYQNSSGASAAATAAGNLYSNVTAYTNAVSAVGQAVLYSQAAALKVAASDLLSALQNSASGLYSKLKGLLLTPTNYPPGTLLGYGEYTIQLVSVLYTSYCAYDGLANPYYTGFTNYVTGQGNVIISGGNTTCTNGTHSAVIWLGQAVTTDPQNPAPPLPPPPLVPVLPGAVPAALGVPNGGVLPSDVAGELDDLIKANPSIAHPVNGTATGSSVDDTLPTFVPDLPAGTTPATVPSTTTGTQVPTTDPAVDPPDVYPSTNAVQLRTLDFSKWLEIYGVMQNTFPFSLLTTVSGYLEVLVSDPVAPVFDFPIYRQNNIHVDLSIFDPVAALTRWLIGLLITVGAILGMQKWWRGVS